MQKKKKPSSRRQKGPYKSDATVPAYPTEDEESDAGSEAEAHNENGDDLEGDVLQDVDEVTIAEPVGVSGEDQTVCFDGLLNINPNTNTVKPDVDTHMLNEEDEEIEPERVDEEVQPERVDAEAQNVCLDSPLSISPNTNTFKPDADTAMPDASDEEKLNEADEEMATEADEAMLDAPATIELIVPDDWAERLNINGGMSYGRYHRVLLNTARQNSNLFEPTQEQLKKFKNKKNKKGVTLQEYVDTTTKNNHAFLYRLYYIITRLSADALKKLVDEVITAGKIKSTPERPYQPVTAMAVDDDQVTVKHDVDAMHRFFRMFVLKEVSTDSKLTRLPSY